MAVDAFLRFLFYLGGNVHGTTWFYKHVVAFFETDLANKIILGVYLSGLALIAVQLGYYCCLPWVVFNGRLRIILKTPFFVVKIVVKRRRHLHLILVVLRHTVSVEQVGKMGANCDSMLGVVFSQQVDVPAQRLYVECLFFVKTPSVIAKFVFFGVVFLEDLSGSPLITLLFWLFNWSFINNLLIDFR